MTKKPVRNDNRLAVAYYRYSSESQNEASIQQQREAAHVWAEAKGYSIVAEYEDPAISGTTAERPGYQRMLREIFAIRPAAVILWKSDRLGRDRYELAFARKTIRDAGCRVCYVAEAIPDDDSPEAALMESFLDGMADYYSRQLARNIRRGVRYNAEHCLSNGHKLFGYKIDDMKRYVIDEETAPFVQRIFAEYAGGKPLQEIANDLNEQGVRTGRGGKFNVHGLRRMLKNERYTGVYRCGDFAIEGGMPAIVGKETFRAVQARFERNKRMGSQRAKGKDEESDPRYWLTGKLFCGECGHSMQSTSGTSMTGITHYYYGCGEHLKRHGCKKRSVRKGLVEDAVLQILAYILDDSEMLASLAVDMSSYYRSTYGGDEYLKGLKMKEREVDRSLKNVIDAIEQGAFSDALRSRLAELESQKHALKDAIDAEKAKAALMEDEHGIAAYFQRFAKANLDDPVVRDEVLEYFIDKIYLYDDRLVIVGDFVQYSGSCRYEFGGRVDGFDVRFEMDHDVGSEYDRELEFDQDLQFECFAHSSTMITTAGRG